MFDLGFGDWPGGAPAQREYQSVSEHALKFLEPYEQFSPCETGSTYKPHVSWPRVWV